MEVRYEACVRKVQYQVELSFVLFIWVVDKFILS